jgi:hypothetical protein
VRLISCIILDDVEIMVEQRFKFTNFEKLRQKIYLDCLNMLFSLTGKCSGDTFHCWLEVFHWQMVPCTGMSLTIKNTIDLLLFYFSYIIFKTEFLKIQGEGDYNAKLGITILGKSFSFCF